jgi:hypothetical protein
MVVKGLVPTTTETGVPTLAFVVLTHAITSAAFVVLACTRF